MVETRTEYEVEFGYEGSGWTDGDFFDTIEEAEADFSERLAETRPDRYLVVRLLRTECDYEGDECVEVRVAEVLREARA